MKKIIIPIILIILLTFSMSACSSKASIPGTAWAGKETINYDISYKSKDADSKAISYGTMETVIERITEGKHKLALIDDRDFEVTETVPKGARIKITVKDVDGNQLMYSETLLNGFFPLASYKKVTNGETKYEVKSIFEAKGYRYAYAENGSALGEMKFIKERGQMMDNELLYTILRCYDIESNKYATAFNVPNPVTGKVETLNVGYGGIEKLPAKYRKDSPVVDCTKLVISRTESPIGSPIYASFAPYDDANIIIGNSKSQNSYRMPIKIVEGDLIYNLASVILA